MTYEDDSGAPGRGAPNGQGGPYAQGGNGQPGLPSYPQPHPGGGPAPAAQWPPPPPPPVPPRRGGGKVATVIAIVVLLLAGGMAVALSKHSSSGSDGTTAQTSSGPQPTRCTRSGMRNCPSRTSWATSAGCPRCGRPTAARSTPTTTAYAPSTPRPARSCGR
ncbi:hypothetical protein SAZ11_42620 [Streptomyces sp. FXJ1.4098]|nr:hypothetical protein [Streptomyces sp. FXJ1.4098]